MLGTSQENIRVIFLKERFYRGKKYNKNDITHIHVNDLKAYIIMGVVKVLGKEKTKKKVIDYSKYTYKQLQRICKRRNINAVGKKENLIASLTE